MDSCDNLYIGDNGNCRIRKVAFNPYCWPLDINKTQQTPLSIYPNPATATLHISGVQPHSSYVLYAITGRAVAMGQLQQAATALDIAHLAYGMYVLQLMDGDGVRSIYKVVKE